MTTLTILECVECGGRMYCIGGADHRCDRCGHEVIADWAKMTVIDATLCRLSCDVPNVVPHLIDLCTGDVVSQDHEMDVYQAIACAGLPNTITPEDVVLWQCWREMLAIAHDRWASDLYVRAA